MFRKYVWFVLTKGVMRSGVIQRLACNIILSGSWYLYDLIFEAMGVGFEG